MPQPTQAQGFAVHPLARLAAAFAAGILGRQHLEVSLALLITIALVTTLLAVTALIYSRMKLATVLLTVVLLFLGSSLAAIEETRVPRNQLKRLLSEGAIAVGDPVELTGVLKRDPESAPDRLYFFLRVEELRSTRESKFAWIQIVAFGLRARAEPIRSRR